MSEIKIVRGLIIIFTLGNFIFLACSDNKSVQSGIPGDSPARVESRNAESDRGFILKPKYSYIRSYPGGGGIFIVKLFTSDNTSADFILSLRANPSLNARLDRNTLNADTSVAEITIHPSRSVEIGMYEIELRAIRANPSHIGVFQVITLEVEIFQWGPANPANVIPKRDEFIGWLETEHPELGNFSNHIWFPYMTYPQIWVVEHWTFLDEDWEFRLCYHVMIPPYDWSKILLRRRGEWNPVLAAMRDSDGTIHEIPISEYPIMFGY